MDIVALTDQAEREMESFARLTAKYRAALQRNGFSDADALNLARDFHHAYWQKISATTHAQPDAWEW